MINNDYISYFHEYKDEFDFPSSELMDRPNRITVKSYWPLRSMPNGKIYEDMLFQQPNGKRSYAIVYKTKAHYLFYKFIRKCINLKKLIIGEYHVISMMKQMK